MSGLVPALTQHPRPPPRPPPQSERVPATAYFADTNRATPLLSERHCLYAVHAIQ